MVCTSFQGIAIGPEGATAQLMITSSTKWLLWLGARNEGALSLGTTGEVNTYSMQPFRRLPAEIVEIASPGTY